MHLACVFGDEVACQYSKAWFFVFVFKIYCSKHSISFIFHYKWNHLDSVGLEFCRL